MFRAVALLALTAHARGMLQRGQAVHCSLPAQLPTTASMLRPFCVRLILPPALQAPLPSGPITLVYLNLSLPITQSLT